GTPVDEVACSSQLSAHGSPLAPAPAPRCFPRLAAFRRLRTYICPGQETGSLCCAETSRRGSHAADPTPPWHLPAALPSDGREPDAVPRARPRIDDVARQTWLP